MIKLKELLTKPLSNNTIWIVKELLQKYKLEILLKNEKEYVYELLSDLSWYHGNIGRTTAESMLRERIYENGYFLIRNSISIENELVLSVIYNCNILHIPIIQHQFGLTFQLYVENSKNEVAASESIQGIEKCVQHYQEFQSILPCQLSKYFVAGRPPPSHLCKFSFNRLTHIFSFSGDETLLLAILKQTKPNLNELQSLLNSKSLDGSTVLHLAAKHGHRSIFFAIIQYIYLLLNVNKAQQTPQEIMAHSFNIIYDILSARDSLGDSIFHILCKHSDIIILSALLDKQILRESLNFDKNFEVKVITKEDFLKRDSFSALLSSIFIKLLQQPNPFTECIKMLLTFVKVAIDPRNFSKETPMDLAINNGHTQCADYLERSRSLKRTEYNVQLKSHTQNSINNKGLNNKETNETFHISSNGNNITNDINPFSFHGIDRLKAEDILNSQNGENGTFLIRTTSDSTQRDMCDHALSLSYEGNVFHFRIEFSFNYYSIEGGPLFANFKDIIDHYSRFSDGLPCPLTNQITGTFSNVSKCLANDSPNIFENIETNQTNLQLKSIDVKNNATESINHKRNFKVYSENSANIGASAIINRGIHNISIQNSGEERARNGFKFTPVTVYKDPNILEDNLENTESISIKNNGSKSQADKKRSHFFKDIECRNIEARNLKLDCEIGSGEFGSVFRGKICVGKANWSPVAIKTLHPDYYPADKENFLSEAKVMTELVNDHIVKFLGICTSASSIMMIQEIAEFGSLWDYIPANVSKINVGYDFPNWAFQIAKGMSYLESKHFVHRDLAARNILVFTHEKVKITDFGLSRVLALDSNYYRSTTGGKWPIKWYAPESINFGKFSHLSDIWSYGVTSWEIYSFSSPPYDEMSGLQVINSIEKGYRLPKPDKCEKEIYDIMLKCWSARSSNRPTFSQLTHFFEQRLRIK
ncbi:unnamed protein product [Gordionus sp. m RMFG-2023]